jgi:hypothetical protein
VEDTKKEPEKKKIETEKVRICNTVLFNTKKYFAICINNALFEMAVIMLLFWSVL